MYWMHCKLYYMFAKCIHGGFNSELMEIMKENKINFHSLVIIITVIAVNHH